ncbi:MAG TPA: hypothetical protein VK807_08240 [Gemmatimonadaceae bacterium]|jgi:hypothetical protein|nr:hypothetical protein [Gemmatimonadaceae bacterium]
MAGAKMDGAGIEKMKTLETAQSQLQRVHGLVEQFAMAVKNAQPATIYGAQIKRAGTPMVGLLKGQFGMISDQLAAAMVVAGRTGSDKVRLRSLRETVAQVRTALEIAVAKTIELHTEKEEEH